MSLLSEFKEFAVKGNVVDMAVGIIVGAAFGKIVSSLVKDIIMPPVGLLLGGVNFSDLNVVLKEAQGEVTDATGTIGIGRSVRETPGAPLILLKALGSVIWNIPYCMKRREPCTAEDFELPIS